ncbi:hypothetical protein ACJ5NV_06565 [Loktanella agnita]|uniref:hypothetical protein n=1 Tax=Loktanella agnita TaxID=287097 RepID=UPI0039875E36
MVDQTYYRAESFLNMILDMKPISDQGLQEALHEYITLGELEIAFEGAFLWYLEHEVEFSRSQRDEILKHGRALGIHEERSIDEEAWEKFQSVFGEKTD